VTETEAPRGPGGLGRIVRENGWPLADQGVMSATNFLTVVVLARALVPAEFGAFVLAYTTLLFANGFQTALVTQPHNVLGQARTGEEYARYTASTALAQGGFSVAAALLALVAAAVLELAGVGGTGVALALAPALVAWQLQEFTRRVLYTEGRLGAAFWIDVLSYGGQAAALVALAQADVLTAPRALLVVAATSALGAAVGAWTIRGSLLARTEATFLRENWAFGKWLAAATAASWLTAQLFVYVIAIVDGAGAAGALRATQTLLGPLNAFVLFLATVLPIRFAAAYARGGEAPLRRTMHRAYLASLPVVLLYGLAVSLAAEPLLRWLYGSTYEEYGTAVALFALFYVAVHAGYLGGAVLNARRDTRSLFVANVYAAVVGLVLGWPLVEAWGVNGAVAGMLLTVLVLNVFVWRSYRLNRGPAADRLAPAP
jgi:O-antigen/teichoic acid export membrane protein